MRRLEHMKIENIGAMAGEYSLDAGISFLRVISLCGVVTVALGLVSMPLFIKQADHQLTAVLFNDLSHQAMAKSSQSNNLVIYAKAE